MLAKLSGVPSKPGVYILKDTKNRVLYVGKAKNLKNRLRSYFQKSTGLDIRKTAMIRDVRDFSYVVTGNELEAFILEANLIKQYKPRFNVILRDDKNYPYLKLTINEEWPRLEVVRKIKTDGALYFGPYVPSGSIWEILAFIRRNFQIVNCRYSFDKPMRPCIQHQMGKCLAPCAGLISKEDYLKLIDEIKLFLKGEKKGLIYRLEKKMMKLSEGMMFEEAAKIRDRIKALEGAWESQKVVAPELGDMDVTGFYRKADKVSFRIFFIRNGIMIGSKDLFVKNIENVSDKELMRTFITQFYSKEIIPPSQIISPAMPDESKSLENWLTQRKGTTVKIMAPQKGKKKELLDMAIENAYLVYRDADEPLLDELLIELKENLKLKKTPSDIAAFDVSTISGNESVGSFVWWSDGEFQKDKYRKLKIKTVKGINDYSMMEEIIGRIIGNLEGRLPDLIIIDGGKGQLETAKKVIDRNPSVLKNPPMLIAVAKDPDRAYIKSLKDPVYLEDGKPSSLLLKKIRDEAHRFAIGYHKKLREKNFLLSPLENIPGIGKKRRLELLRVFGSIKNIRNATIEEIAGLRGFNRRVAENLSSGIRRV
ncbi:MAG: excinuclease ABC subunit C [Nitrospirae bacterium RBG_13_39_12]|nr:MAG: excinuclease ABC subunit C [Nitrospirae bacterium RBG_13_39_12]